MIFYKPVFSDFGSTITHIHVYIWLHAFQYLYVHYCCCYVSPGCPDLDQMYPMSLSDDLIEDALHDLLERIDICEGLVSPNPWSGREIELQ